MLSLRALGAIAAAIGLGAACGGAGFSSAGGSGEDAGAEGSAGEGGGDSAPPEGAAPEGGQAATDAPSSDVSSESATDAPPPPADAPASFDGPGGSCPNAGGSYSIALVASAGCGDLNVTAPECIRTGAGGTCGIEFRSNVSGGAPAGITGTATLKSDGSFEGASLTEGTAMRSGCAGSWAPATSTLSIDCGSTGTSQSCVVSLVRTSTANCN